MEFFFVSVVAGGAYYTFVANGPKFPCYWVQLFLN